MWKQLEIGTYSFFLAKANKWRLSIMKLLYIIKVEPNFAMEKAEKREYWQRRMKLMLMLKFK